MCAFWEMFLKGRAHASLSITLSEWVKPKYICSRAVTVDHAVELCVRDGRMTKGKKSGSLMTKELHSLPSTSCLFVFRREEYPPLISKLQLFGSFYRSQLSISLTHTERQKPDCAGFGRPH